MKEPSIMRSTDQNHAAFTLRMMASVAGMVVMLAGCAASSDFQAVEQQGAKRTGAYPNFAVMPKGETQQLTPQEKDQLAASLLSAKARQGNVPAGAGLSAAQLEQKKRLLQAETAETLKEIETGK